MPDVFALAAVNGLPSLSSGLPSYRVRMPKREENRLELVPMSVALRFEEHLARVAQIAGGLEATDPLFREISEAGELRFDVEGFSLCYRFDPWARIIEVLAVNAHTARDA